MNFKSCTMKNFLSVGNCTQAINLDSGELTLIIGENLDLGSLDSGNRNGVGKTVIVNAISFALFGNPIVDDIKKDNLINKINGNNMLVTLIFEKNNIIYKIERGRKPNILKFYKDGTELRDNNAHGENRDTQKEINELIGMTLDMFKHIVALNTYTIPFLQMKTSDQRMIIEQLLGITLLSEKAEILAELVKNTKKEIFLENATIEATKKSNEKIQQSIDTLITRQKVWNKQYKIDINDIELSISELLNIDIEKEIIYHSDLKLYNEYNSKLINYNKEKTTLISSLTQELKNNEHISNDLNKTSHKKCHACEQDLHDEKHSEMITKLSKKLEDSNNYIKTIQGKIEKVSNDIDNLITINKPPQTFYSSMEDALRHQNILESLNEQLVNKKKEVDPYNDQILELQNTAITEINWDNINTLTILKNHQDFLLKLLTSKDSFLRKKIIDQNLAFLNSRLEHYLYQVGLPHSVVFQNDLSVEIIQLGQDLDFGNLSRGERNRLILSLSWSFRDLFENLYQPINLLFIDEMLDNGLDGQGIECSLSILKQMVRERNKNIFLISHKDELVGRVNSIMTVKKENGFTTYEI